MADNGVVAAGGRLTDRISLGVLASSVPRDAVDDAVAAAGRQARRSDGKLPPHVMVYFVMALALFADDDYEEVAARLTETLSGVGLLGRVVERADVGRDHPGPRSGWAMSRWRSCSPQVAVPVAEELTAGRVPGALAADGHRRVRVGRPGHAGERGRVRVRRAGARRGPPAFPKVRVVTVSECASHAVADAAMGGVAGKGAGEQSLARKLYRGWRRTGC